jgi:hypothetical protein
VQRRGGRLSRCPFAVVAMAIDPCPQAQRSLVEDIREPFQRGDLVEIQGEVLAPRKIESTSSPPSSMNDEMSVFSFTVKVVPMCASSPVRATRPARA